MVRKSARGAVTAQSGDEAVGAEIYGLAHEIYPICRSIAGQGVRDTLDVLAQHVKLDRHAVPTGERLFDWTVPKEWTIRDAFIEDVHGNRVLDFTWSNLHVVSHSPPVHRFISLRELKEHVITLPDRPKCIPYRTSYFEERWGFCMEHERLRALKDGQYEVYIDAELKDGNLDYGEYLHRGESEREFLLSAHICHPSLANDNCSGLALLTLLARDLATRKTRYSYRFLFAPETVGALAWLSRNEDRVPLIEHGIVIAGVGDAGGPAYKRSRRGDTFIDRAMAHVLSRFGSQALIEAFSPDGHEERHFCSPGFDMPVGLFQNSAFGRYPEYHTSADALDFIKPEYLARSYRIIMDVIDIVEQDYTPLNLSPKGEPDLDRRNLHPVADDADETAMAMRWVLNLADGRHSLLDMAEHSGLAFTGIAAAARTLEEHDLLAPVSN